MSKMPTIAEENRRTLICVGLSAVQPIIALWPVCAVGRAVAKGSYDLDPYCPFLSIQAGGIALWWVPGSIVRKLELNAAHTWLFANGIVGG